MEVSSASARASFLASRARLAAIRTRRRMVSSAASRTTPGPCPARPRRVQDVVVETKPRRAFRLNDVWLDDGRRVRFRRSRGGDARRIHTSMDGTKAKDRSWPIFEPRVIFGFAEPRAVEARRSILAP